MKAALELAQPALVSLQPALEVLDLIGTGLRLW
jgi:hypothetical protein